VSRRPSFSIWAGRGESDNLRRATNAERGSYDALGALLTAEHDSTRVSGRIFANVEVRGYSLPDVDDETIGRLDGSVDFNVAADIFHWRLRETYDQGRTDAFGIWGPGNRESINVFSTGPHFEVPIARRTALEIGGDHRFRRHEKSGYADNDSVLYDFAVLRDLDDTTRVGVVTTLNDVDFSDTAIAAYEIDTKNLRYDKTLATGRALVEWGTNELRSQSVSITEPYVNVEWFKNIASRSTLGVTARRRFTDVGAAQEPAEAGALPPADPDLLISTIPFEREELVLGYVIRTERTNVALGTGVTENRYYLDPTTDNETTTLRVGVTRVVSPQLQGGILFGKLVRDFITPAVGAAPEEEDRSISVWLDRRLGRRLSASLVVSRYRRPGAPSVHEDRYALRFSYSPSESTDEAFRYSGL
jgi:hypothetical protein